MQSWLNAYHHIDTTAVLDHGILESRSGPIQAAINLEIHSSTSSHLDIKIEGLNGQLPNLDLFNVAVELCTRESVSATFHGHSQPMETNDFDLWKEYATTTASMMISQAIALPTGAHGLFQRFAIQAITLEASEVSNKKENYLRVSLLQMGRVVEGIFRSLNNLLERFNRSYYFYLLPSTRRYISIGYYMIPFGLITVPSVLNALYLYFKASEATTETKSNENLWTCLPSTVFTHVLGLSLLLVPLLVERYSHLTQGYESHHLLYYTIVTICVLYIVSPLHRASSSDRNSRKSLALLNIALLMSCLSLVNISLALALALIYVPIACLSALSRNIIVRSTNQLLLLALHPLALNYLCLLVMSLWYSPDHHLSQHLFRAFEAQKKCILFYIEDWYIYGNWMYPIATSLLLPAWLQLWLIV